MQAASAKEIAGEVTPPVTSSQPLSTFWRTARNNVRLLQQSPPIQLAPRLQPLPLSFNQERLWRLERLQPESSVHNILHSFRLVGALDITVLEQSLQEIARRHEALRTTFLDIDGQPTQQIASETEVPFSLMNLCNLTPEAQAIEVQNQAIAQAEKPFDLEKGPLWRVALLQLSDEEYILLRTIHHIIFDGVSHSIFVRELGALYSALVQGEPSPLIDLPVQYADFAWTQRQWLQGDMLTSQLGYWQQYFSGNVTPLELPTDFPRAAATSYQGAYESSVLPAELTEALRALSARSGVSLFVTLFAAFNTLLHQYTGQEDIIVCSPVSGRHRAETRGLIGYFNNMVALRQDLSTDPSFDELLVRVSQNFMETSNYQDVPLQLVAELPNLVRLPLTRAMFVLQNAPTPILELEGLHVSSVFVDREVANFDLSLSVYEKAGQLTAVLQYKVALFRPDTIAQMLEQYLDLLVNLVNKPEQRLSDLPRLGQAEAQLDHPSQGKPSQPVPARNIIEQELTQIWETVFKTQPIGVIDNFFDLGGHSLLAVQILTGIENQFCRQLPISTLLQSPTIAGLAEIIQKADEGDITDDLIPLRRGGNKPPLFCIYGILLYQYLASCLNSDQPVYGVYLREEIELLKTGQVDQLKSTFSDVQTVATRYLEIIRKQQPHGPYYLCGESFGGVIAYEMAQQLRAIGEEVALVALFDSWSADCYQQKHTHFTTRLEKHWQLIRSQGLTYCSSKIKPYLQKVKQSVVAGLIRLYQLLHPVLATITNKLNITNKLQWQRSLDQLDQLLESLAKEIQQAVAETTHDDIRSQVRHEMMAKYNAQPYPGKLLLFRATERDTFENVSYDLGWKRVAGNDFHILDVPGDHLSILEKPNVQILAEKLQAHISETVGRADSMQSKSDR